MKMGEAFIWATGFGKDRNTTGKERQQTAWWAQYPVDDDLEEAHRVSGLDLCSLE